MSVMATRGLSKHIILHITQLVQLNPGQGNKTGLHIGLNKCSNLKVGALSPKPCPALLRPVGRVAVDIPALIECQGTANNRIKRTLANGHLFNPFLLQSANTSSAVVQLKPHFCSTTAMAF